VGALQTHHIVAVAGEIIDVRFPKPLKIPDMLDVVLGGRSLVAIGRRASVPGDVDLKPALLDQKGAIHGDNR
jgi:hypothetical protein